MTPPAVLFSLNHMFSIVVRIGMEKKALVKVRHQKQGKEFDKDRLKIDIHTIKHILQGKLFLLHWPFLANVT